MVSPDRKLVRLSLVLEDRLLCMLGLGSPLPMTGTPGHRFLGHTTSPLSPGKENPVDCVSHSPVGRQIQFEIHL